MRHLSTIASVIFLMTLVGGPLGCSRKRLAEKLDRQARGADVYRTMCAVCHGPEGRGYAADQAPALAAHEFLASASDAYLRDAIALGRSNTTMSAWGVSRGGPLSGGDVDAVIAFMRLWDRGPVEVADERPLAGDPGRGAEIYARDCERCHGARGIGGPYLHIGSFDVLSDATNGYLRFAIARGRSRTPMKPFAASLGASGVDDTVALLRSWQSTAEPARRSTAARTPPLPLGPVPLNPHGPAPLGFRTAPATTPAAVVKDELDRHARLALLDARAPSDYANQHIIGAVSVPFYDPAPYLRLLPKDVWYVCYCACPHAESGQLAKKLMAAGFKNVTVLDEGLGVWQARGYGTRSGVDP
ncbi:MAG: c-type cytochrome [Polyangiaceae bacterium]|jgi:mono/diheme cytochrome c family protein/rhodanese-related sulfurtransferase